MSGDGLVDLAVKLDRVLSDLEPVQHAIGGAAKRVALRQLSAALGDDRQLSGFKRRVTLNAGYDIGNPVYLNLRPKGLIVLVDKGRKRTKTIRPAGRGRGRALMTPHGPRATSTSTPSRGLKIVEKITAKCDEECPPAASEALGKIIGDELK